MEVISIILVAVITSVLAVPYRSNIQQREYSYGGGSSSSTGFNFSPWARSHMDDVNEMAEKMRQQYNILSRGGGSGSSYSSSYTTHYPDFTGKSQEELDLLARHMTEDIIRDMRMGKIGYNQISQPLWFEQQAALKLESLNEQEDLQQQSQSFFDEDRMSFTSSPSFSSYSGQGRDVETIQVNEGTSHISYPPSVTIINGRQYITKKNCTTSTSTGATIPTGWATGSGGSESIFTYNKTETRNSGPIYVGGGKMKGIYSYLNESQVKDYEPEAVIPVVAGQAIFPSGGNKVTIEEYNMTRVGYPGQPDIVTGSKAKKVIIDGKVVYDWYNPFGNFSSTKDDEWRRKEREHLFWLFQWPSFTIEDLKRWQVEQEDRLHDIAYNYNTTIENIEEWHLQELQRFKELFNQYDVYNRELTDWQRNERARIDWLIHQNAITIDELEKWQQNNRNKLYNLAKQYKISLDELENWQRRELHRLYVIFNRQNSEIDSLKAWQDSERQKLNNILLSHNTTVEELQESIRRDQQRLKELAHTYHLNVEEMEKWLKSELQRLTGIMEQQKEEMTRIANWQINERVRLENIIRNHNFTVEEVEEKLRRDRNHLYDLARQYKVSIEEIQDWQKQELKRLQNQGLLQMEQELKEWQKNERDRLQLILQNHNLTIREMERRLKHDQDMLTSIAQKYHVSVEEIKQWQKEELQRLQKQEFSKFEKQLQQWQQQERDRLLAVIHNHNLTIAELEKGLKQDQIRVHDLARQYHTSVEELRKWQQEEIKRLQKEGLHQLETQLKEWQQNELNRILVILRNHNLTIEELEKRLEEDKNRLFQIANQYHVSVDEIKEWQRQEIKRLQELGVIQIENQLKEWQKAERNRLLDIILRHNLTISDLEAQLKVDQNRLYNLARQYKISVEEIREWQMNEIQRMKELAEEYKKTQLQWQQEERNRLMGIINQHNLTIAQLEQRLKHDQKYLEFLAQQYHTSIEEIKKLQQDEIKRLQSQSLIEIQKQLKEWQQQEFNIILDIIRRHNVSIEELEKRLKQDEARLHTIAQEYHISVEEIKAWQQQEIKKLQELGLIKIHEQIRIWQENEKARLMRLIQENNLSIAELARQLREDRARLERLAQQYHFTIEQIEDLLILEFNQPSKSIEHLSDWEIEERNYINTLVRQHYWTIRELEIKLKQDRKRLYKIVDQYHTTVKEIEEFYRRELNRLLYEGSIGNSNIERLTEWQKEELEKLYKIIQQYDLTIQELEDRLRTDRSMWENLARRYRIAVEELENWLRNEYRRLLELGLIRNNLPNEDFSNWRNVERKRLETIAREVKITLDEFEEFLKDDHEYQEILCKKYVINMPDLLSFQKYELQRMLAEGKLQHVNLKRLKEWQKLERDRIFLLIQKGILDITKLKEWQNRNQGLLQKLATEYRINIQTLEDFQRSEMERLHKLAKYYGMLITQIESFRSRELDRLSMYAHQYTTTIDLFDDWTKRESYRMMNLSRRYSLALNEQLADWRRRLFLLCQGLIDFDKVEPTITNGIDGKTTTNATNRHNVTISKDRGDQPPQYYNEDEYEESEPGLWRAEPTTSRSSSPWSEAPPYSAPLAPLPTIPLQVSMPVQSESGSYYHKKEVTLTGPVISGVDLGGQHSEFHTLSHSLGSTVSPIISRESQKSESNYQSHQTFVPSSSTPVISKSYESSSVSQTKPMYPAVSPKYYESQHGIRGLSPSDSDSNNYFSGSQASSTYSIGSYSNSYAGNRGAHATTSGLDIPFHQGSTQVQYISGGGSQGQSYRDFAKETEYEDEEEDVQRNDHQFQMEAFELNDQQRNDDLTQKAENYGQTEDFGQHNDFQQFEQEKQYPLKYQQEELNQQQQNIKFNDKIMSHYSNQPKDAQEIAKVEEIKPDQVEEIQAQPVEEEKSIWSKIKDKAKTVFG